MIYQLYSSDPIPYENNAVFYYIETSEENFLKILKEWKDTIDTLLDKYELYDNPFKQEYLEISVDETPTYILKITDWLETTTSTFFESVETALEKKRNLEYLNTKTKSKFKTILSINIVSQLLLTEYVLENYIKKFYPEIITDIKSIDTYTLDIDHRNLNISIDTDNIILTMLEKGDDFLTDEELDKVYNKLSEMNTCLMELTRLGLSTNDIFRNIENEISNFTTSFTTDTNKKN